MAYTRILLRGKLQRMKVPHLMPVRIGIYSFFTECLTYSLDKTPRLSALCPKTMSHVKGISSPSITLTVAYRPLCMLRRITIATQHLHPHPASSFRHGTPSLRCWTFGSPSSLFMLASTHRRSRRCFPSSTTLSPTLESLHLSRRPNSTRPGRQRQRRGLR